MESDVRTSSRPSRRVLGALVALLAVTGLGFTACSDNEPADPSISGNSPGEVTVPTLPATTTTGVPTDTTDTTETTSAPATSAP